MIRQDELESSLQFSKDMVVARKRDNHNHIQTDSSLAVQQIQLTGLNMMVKQINRSLTIKRRNEKDSKNHK